jgi:DNA topoisomerase-3
MEDQAIRDGFAHLEPSSKYDALYEAALCRERADWIVGMNATRLFSCLYHQTLNVGRVMTPTLAMVVMRDAEIAAFVSKPFYTVQLGMDGITAASRRFDDKEDAQEVLAKCKESMKAMVKSVDRKEKTEHAPLLYDLTSLQRDANRILGFTAQQTLNYTQALYEKKLVTYPRTDSRYLTEDMKPMRPALITQVAEKIGADAAAWKADNGTELFVDGMCDSRKVSDHHAIIPTGTMCAADLAALPSGEKAILQLIAVRLLCAAAPNHRYAEDMIVLVCGGEDFTKKVRTVLYGGWKDIWQHFYTSKEKEQESYGGPILYPNAMVPFPQAEIKEGKTTAPKHFTDVIFCERKEWIGIEERSSA